MEPCVNEPDSSTITLARFRADREQDLPFEILETERLPPSALRPRPVRHTFYVMHWLKRGSGTYSIDFRPHAILPDTFYFLTPGQVHSWHIDEPVAGFTIVFTHNLLNLPQDPEFLRHVGFFHHLEADPVLRARGSRVETFDRLVGELLGEYRATRSGRRLAIESLLQLLLLEVQRAYQEERSGGAFRKPSAGATLVSKFQQLVDADFLTLRTVEELARHLHVSAGHLSATVKELTGLPAGTHVRQRVALEAKRLLAHTDQSVQQIGYQLGFEDPSYFARFFRRESGRSPKRFRDEIREKYQLS